MLLVDDSGSAGTPCKRLSTQGLKAASSKLASRILELLASRPEGMHAAALAQALKEPEQKVYYHSRKLLASGILRIDHTEDARGGTAKVLALAAPSFALRFGQSAPLARTQTGAQMRFLFPFIDDGALRAKIVIGSPDPHGPEGARGRDANYATDLGLFLGSFLQTRTVSSSVVLDTELRDWQQNLIILGGPVVNKAAERVSTQLLRYDRERKEFIVGKKRYAQDETGIIAKLPNPFAPGRWILLLAGKRHAGTRAAILTLLSQFDSVCADDDADDEGRARPVRPTIAVVLGVDADSDGVVDSARILDIVHA